MTISRRRFNTMLIGSAISSGCVMGSRNVWGQSPSKTKKAYAICIGLSRLSGTGYWNGFTGELQGTVPDAKLYADVILPNASPFKIKTLFDDQADSRNVYRHILWAANDLRDGDLFVVAYAGHGMQVPDDSGDEDDRKDEAMCLWDRPLIDDELAFMWSFFDAGVRVVLVTDSCHSGTQARELDLLADLKSIRSQQNQSVASRAAEFRASKGATRSPASQISDIDAKSTKLRSIVSQENSRAVPSLSDLVKSGNERSTIGTRRVPAELATALAARDNQTNRLLATSIRELGVQVPRNDGKGAIKARIVSISGCQDNQVSMEEGGHGVFTSTLFSVWGNGQFNGTYDQFARAIRSAMPQSQQPNLDPFGNGSHFEASDRAFRL